MTQLSLDDCIQATETALEQAEIGSGSIWMAEAMETIERVARAQPELTVNDIWKAGLSQPSCNRAIGAAMRRAKQAGMILATDKRRPSLQTHMSPVMVWQSLMYGRGA